MEQVTASAPADGAVAMSPVPVAERIEAIDVLRGVALFGILAANMRGFFAPAPVYFRPELMWTSGLDAAVQHAIDFFISGKFVTIFGTLFGVGFAIQMDRARDRGDSTAFHRRRMAVLLLFGLLHIALLWFGDILHSYAIAGFALLAFRNKSENTILRWALALFWFPMVLMTLFLIGSWMGAKPPDFPEPTPQLIQEHTRIFQQGTFVEMMRRRIADWGKLSSGFLFFMPRILGVMLFGMWLWRRGLLRDVDERRDLFTSARRIGLAVGFAAGLAAFAVQVAYHPNPMKPSGWGWIMMMAMSVSVPFLSMGYSAHVLMAHRSLGAFASVGRMALTNYLLQSLVCTTIFNSYGGALFGKMGPAGGLVLTVVIYGLQIPLSQWWLSSHRYGPLEWLWRRFTYASPTAPA